MSIDVLNETDHDVDEVEFVDLSRYVLEQMRVHPQAELCIRFVDAAAIEVLHEQRQLLLTFLAGRGREAQG